MCFICIKTTLKFKKQLLALGSVCGRLSKGEKRPPGEDGGRRGYRAEESRSVDSWQGRCQVQGVVKDLDIHPLSKPH